MDSRFLENLWTHVSVFNAHGNNLRILILKHVFWNLSEIGAKIIVILKGALRLHCSMALLRSGRQWQGYERSAVGGPTWRRTKYFGRNAELHTAKIRNFGAVKSHVPKLPFQVVQCRRSILTRPGLKGLGSHAGGSNIYIYIFFPHLTSPALVCTQLSVHRVMSHFPRGKWPGRGFDHPHHMAPKLSMSGAACLLLFLASCGIYRGNFTFHRLQYGSGVEIINYSLFSGFQWLLNVTIPDL
jgi:hypothetical protein